MVLEYSREQWWWAVDFIPGIAFDKGLKIPNLQICPCKGERAGVGDRMQDGDSVVPALASFPPV